MKSKKIKLVAGILAIFICLGGCGQSKKEGIESKTEEATQEVTTAVTEEPTTEDPHAGQVKSRLSGNWVEKEVAERRPIAIMINNIKQAQPQSGILKADIIYECLAEGGITRLLGIIERYDEIKKLGSVRSARHYYVQIANEYDAIFAHYGQTKYAVSEIQRSGIDTLSGLSSLGDQIYFRDPNRRAPHNAYIDTKGFLEGIKQQKYRTTYEKRTKGHFRFREEMKKPVSDQAKKITLGYSNYTTPYFEYDAKLRQYRRYQYGEKQIDDQEKRQLTYRNVIVQFVKEWDIDHNGYQTMDLIASGKGYYATMGTYQPITWKKKSQQDITKYYDEKGRELRLNSGKTWICVFPKQRADRVVFE